MPELPASMGPSGRPGALRLVRAPLHAVANTDSRTRLCRAGGERGFAGRRLNRVCARRRESHQPRVEIDEASSGVGKAALGGVKRRR